MKQITTYLFLFFSFNLYSQVKALDSINFYSSLALKERGSKKISFLKKTVFFANQTKNDSIIYKTNVELGVQSFYIGSIQDLTYSNKNIKSLYLSKKDSVYLAKNLHFKALEQRIKLNIDSAFYYYHQSKNISKRLNDSLAIGRRLLSMANLQLEIKDYLGCEITCIEALKYLEPLKESTTFVVSLYNTLALTSQNQKLYDDAIFYFRKANLTNKNNKNPRRKTISFLLNRNNIGLLYQNQDQHKKAVKYFNEGLAFDSIKEKYPNQYALLLENLAYSSYSINKTDNVLNQYNEVLDVRQKLKNYKGVSTTHINISNYYKDTEQIKQAIFHANEALKYAKQTRYNQRILDAMQTLSSLTKGKQSKQYLEDYIQLNDSLFQEERIKKNQYAKITYETEKKEKENIQLKIDNEYQKQQTIIGWLVAASILLLFGFSVSFFTFRRKRLLFEAQLQKAAAREQERKQIAKSLHDEVAGDLRMLHQKLEKSQLFEEASKLNDVKENVRNLSHQLSSVSFKKVPFKDQIINLVSDYFSLDFRIKVNGLQEHDWTQVNSPIKRLLYLSIRESIQNCKKYAEANLITIDFSIHKKYVFLSIADNGTGFDTTKSKKGIGLRNLQERVEELSGTLNIESEVGKGTQIHIQIPLNA